MDLLDDKWDINRLRLLSGILFILAEIRKNCRNFDEFMCGVYNDLKDYNLGIVLEALVVEGYRDFRDYYDGYRTVEVSDE
jgi:hypothetical protein